MERKNITETFGALAPGGAPSTGDSTPTCQCGGSSGLHLGGSICLSCLLRAGLETGDSDGRSADAELDFSDIPDGHWRLGGYELLEEIGRGGMGIIYRARQPHSNRLVALKRILPHLGTSPELGSRMLREAQAVASLDHPNILPVYDVGEGPDGLPFFSMKLASGGSLSQRRSALRGETRKVVELLLKVSRAVQYAHGRQILHRDLKPGNILLDGAGEPLVADFGLAKWLSPDADQASQTIAAFGTPGYAAPEQAGGPSCELTAAADIYSLGAILFELLAGRPPFIGENAWAVVKQATEHPAPKLRTLAPKLDRDLETICDHCLEREPKARYSAAGDLADDLQCWLDGRSIHARPVSPPERAWRWVRRNRVLAAVGAGCIILAGIGVNRQVQTLKWEETVRNQALDLRSMTVLPFEDIDHVGSNSTIAREWTNALQNSLEKSREVRIKNLQDKEDWNSGFSKAHFKQLADSIGIKTLVVGTIRETGGKQRIAVRLYNAQTGELLQRAMVEYSGDMPGASVNQLSQIVLGWYGPGFTVEPTLSDPLMTTTNPAARDYLITGQEYFQRRTPEDLQRALNSFEKAIELDPRYALAQSYLASASSAHFLFTRDPVWMEKAFTHARKAIQLNPDLAEAHRSLGVILFMAERYPEAQEACLDSYEIDPLLARAPGTLADIYRALGKPVQALQWSVRNQKLKTRPGEDYVYVGNALVLLKRDVEAEKILREGMSFMADQTDCRIELARLRLAQGRIEEARLINTETLSLFPEDGGPLQLAMEIEFYAKNFSAVEKSISLIRQSKNKGVPIPAFVSLECAEGFIQLQKNQEAGKRILNAELAKLMAQLKTRPNSSPVLFEITAVEAAMGDLANATEHFRKAVSLGWIEGYRQMEIDPRFTQLLGTPEGKKIFANLNDRIISNRRE